MQSWTPGAMQIGANEMSVGKSPLKKSERAKSGGNIQGTTEKLIMRVFSSYN